MTSLPDVLSPDYLSCPVCTRVYTQPCVLPCLHSACRDCLREYCSKRGSTDCDTKRYACPICEELGVSGKTYSLDDMDQMDTNYFLMNLSSLSTVRHTTDPRPCDYCSFDGGDATDTSDASHVSADSYCLECQDYLCARCVDAHRRTKLTRAHTTASLDQVRAGCHDAEIRANHSVPCPAHASEPISFYCSACDALVCRECKVTVHEGHACCRLDAVAGRYREKAGSLLQVIQNKFPNIEVLVSFLSEYGRYIDQRREDVTAAITAQADRLHAMVDDYKTRLIADIQSRCAAESSTVLAQRTRAQTTHSLLASTARYTSALLAHAAPAEVLTSRHTTLACLSELANKPLDKVNAKMALGFGVGKVREANLAAMFGTVTCVREPLGKDSTDDSEKGTTDAAEKETTEAVEDVATENYMQDAEDHLNIVDDIPTHDKSPASPVVQEGSPEVQASFVKLQNAISLNKNGFPSNDGGNMVAMESTENLVASTSTESIGKSVELVTSFECAGLSDTKDMWPTGLAIASSDRIVVMDRENRKVKMYDSSGSFLREFGAGTLGCAYDVAVMKNGNIAVTDYDQEDVKIFTPDGTLRAKLKGPMKYPRGIAIDREGNIIIVDAHSHRLIIHEPIKGKVLRIIDGRCSSHKGDVLSEPYYVTTNPEGNIVVTDWLSPNVKIFSQDGRYVSRLQSYGTSSTEHTLQPYGVCTDRHGNIYFADNQNHRIHLLSPDGRFVKFVVSKQHGLWHPMAVAVNSQGHLVVTEALGKVKVFKLS